MKRTIILLLIGFSLVSYSDGLMISSYNISADFTKDSNYADIITECNVLIHKQSNSAFFLLNSNVKINSIELLYHGILLKTGHNFTGKDSIIVDIPDEMTGFDTIVVTFKYSYPINIFADSINILDRGHRWYPLIPDNIAPFTIKCTLPNDYTSLSISELHETMLKGGGYEHIWQCKYPVFKIPLIIYREYTYTIYDSDFSGKFLALNYFKNDSLKADSIIQKARGILNFCETYIGNFGFPELTFVEIPGLQGMNIGSGLIMAGTDDMKYISNGYYDGLYLTCIQQWFGAGVFAKYGSPGFWLLSLSLPHYLRMLYIKETQGYEAYNKELTGRLEKYKSFAGSESDIPVTDIDFINTAEKGQILYIKGPYIFYKLHTFMGDEKWHNFIRGLYEEYAGKVMSLDDFKNTLMKFDNEGKTIETFNNMITKKGLPE